MVISILLKIGMLKFFKILHIGLMAKNLNFQKKKLNDINFFLIIIAGWLESANSSFLAGQRLFKDLVGKKIRIL